MSEGEVSPEFMNLIKEYSLQMSAHVNSGKGNIYSWALTLPIEFLENFTLDNLKRNEDGFHTDLCTALSIIAHGLEKCDSSGKFTLSYEELCELTDSFAVLIMMAFLENSVGIKVFDESRVFDWKRELYIEITPSMEKKLEEMGYGFLCNINKESES